jgi:ATP-dependent Clp protease adaptor protein ClpS
MSSEKEKDATPAPAVAVKPRERARPKSTQPLPPYHVILLDDNDHSVEYVVEMMLKLFSYPRERGLAIAVEVDTQKRVIVFTTHKELAEMKQELIHGYGADPRVDSSPGSMKAIIVPAE